MARANFAPAGAPGALDGPTPGSLDEPQVRAMFDRIAGLYDRMNTVMTVGLHHQWRRRAADLAQLSQQTPQKFNNLVNFLAELQ